MAHKRPTVNVALSKKEAARIGDVCLLGGGNADDVASGLISDAFARRMRKKTGKAPAKIYQMKKK